MRLKGKYYGFLSAICLLLNTIWKSFLENWIAMFVNLISKLLQMQWQQMKLRKNSFQYTKVSTHLPISQFVVNEKFLWNASKLSIFYIYENPKLLIPFFISCNFIFLPNECRYRPGHSLGKKIKLHKMKNTTWVFLLQKYGKFWGISLGH